MVREFDDRTAMEIALVENVQRRDLGPLEEAEGYRRLTSEYGHSQEEIARAVGKSRSHIANTMRLLNLPEDVRGLLDDNQLSAGHARALLAAEDAGALAREVVSRKLNVRETERLVQRARHGDVAKPRASRPVAEKDADTLALERALRDQLGLPVSIDFDPQSGAGRVIVRYADLDQLDLVVARLSGTTGSRTVPDNAVPDNDDAVTDNGDAIPSWSFDDDDPPPLAETEAGVEGDDQNGEHLDDPLIPRSG